MAVRSRLYSRKNVGISRCHRRGVLQWAVEALEPRTLLSVGWQSVAIGGGGFVTGLASSTDGTGIYARTDVGGAYRWNATSSQWQPITESLPNNSSNTGGSFGIDSLAVDPTNANKVYISSGAYNYSVPSGIYFTSDASVSTPVWTVLDSTIHPIGQSGIRPDGERLTVDPNNANVLYYGTDNVSGGGTGLKKYYYDTAWHSSTLTTPAIGDANYGIDFVICDKNGGTVSDGTRTVSKYIYIGVYSATAGNGGVYASSNGGTSWTKVTGVSFDKPARGEVAVDGTLYVTYDTGVAKLARGSTVFTSVTPLASVAYDALAVDPSAAGTVMVAEYGGNNATSIIFRSTNSGATWVQMTRNAHGSEPDGTGSVTTSGGLMSVADLLINPANAAEVWVSDMLSVQRTQNIKNDTTASDWYCLQKNFEEVVPLALTSAPTGAPLLSGEADVNGFVHNDPAIRPVWNDKFETPAYISTTGLDFSESTSGSSTVWARVGDVVYYQYNYLDCTGGISLNDGQSWSQFGQLDSQNVTNSTTGGWVTFDVGPYLRQLKASGVNTVTLVVRASTSNGPNFTLNFSSREGSNAPQVLVNGVTTLTATADTYVNGGATTTNYGNSTQLVTKDYYEQANQLWSYVKFDLTSVSSISTAALRLYRLGTASDTLTGTVAVYASPTTSWVEGNGGTDNSPANEMTWTNRPNDLYAPPSGAQGGRIALSTTDPAKLVWIAENGYVYYSKDRGVTWARGTLSGVNLTVDSMQEFQMNRMTLTSDRVAADTFYIFLANGSGTVYRSTDGGATWAVLASATGTASRGNYPNGFKIDAVPGL
ncbi:MAG: hypothetical protein WCI73_09390, partial [Phycisphaerae bacterium]